MRHFKALKLKKRLLYLSPETDVSPNTGLKYVPGASSARLETAPCRSNRYHLASADLANKTSVKKGAGHVNDAHRKSQQRLGSDHDERFAEVADHLPPQQVEVLSGGGGVDHGHVHAVPVHALLFAVTHLRDSGEDTTAIIYKAGNM